MLNISITYVSLDDIIPYVNNPRIHDDKHIKQIVDSISTFSFTNPILLDEHNEILADHGRYLAAKHLKMETVPCVQILHLTPAQKKAYRIADNKLTLNGSWDENLLGLEFKDLSELELDFSLDITGFSLPEIDLTIQSLSEKKEDPLDALPVPLFPPMFPIILPAVPALRC